MEDGEVIAEIYRLDTVSDTWEEVAVMETPRVNHDLSVIEYKEVEGLCSETGKYTMKR